MPVLKMESTDAFVVTDFTDAPASGVVRRGRKILERSATDLARAATYAFAVFGVERGGASAGVNAEGDEAAAALAAMLDELSDELTSGRLELLAGKGVDPSEVHDSAEQIEAEAIVQSAGVLASCAWALGGPLEGRRVVIEGGDPSDPLSVRLRADLAATGAIVVEPEGLDAKPWLVWGSDVDAVLVGSKPGAMNHQGAAMVTASAVVPYGPLPITTKALAVLLKNGVTYVPDFVSAAGSMVAGHLRPGTVLGPEEFGSLVTSRLDELRHSDQPLFLAASVAAEEFISGWQPAKPFGRPLAG